MTSVTLVSRNDFRHACFVPFVSRELTSPADSVACHATKSGIIESSGSGFSPSQGDRSMPVNIKYVEQKTDGLRGIGCIACVECSKTGKTLYWNGRTLIPLGGFAFKANYYDEETFEEFWISNPRQDGSDSLFPTTITIEDGVREQYWLKIRRDSSSLSKTSYKSAGKTKRERERFEKAIRRHDMDRRFRAP